MPRSLDPSSKLTMVLACDVDKPQETQPRIFARNLTLKQQREMMVALKAMQSADNPVAKLDAALDTAEICLTGWENMTDPDTGEDIVFSRDAIADVLSMEELAEIFGFITNTTQATPEDKKKSA